MKPSLNRFFCIGAGKHKMLFATEKKALNFIRFNRDEFDITGNVSPCRAYYCVLCIGWHVTSLPSDQASLLDIHDRLLLHWLLALATTERVIYIIAFAFKFR